MQYSIYIHIPFCTHRCGYCDFNTYAGLQSLIPDYVNALCREIEFTISQLDTRLSVHTIFLGGGTPSLLSASELSKILIALNNSFKLQPEAEITLEANPGTLSRDYLQDLINLGFNRLSIGMQSSHPEELRLLERQHDHLEVIQAVKWARQVGFDNLSLDLIFGLPEQTLEKWQQNIRLAEGLKPDHLSLYALTLEHGTPFSNWATKGLISSPDPDLAADMYEWSGNYLGNDYAQYEISNWARKTPTGIKTCQHNLQYWRNLPYLGFGAGAHGYAGNHRTANVLAPAAYIKRMLSNTAPRTKLKFPCTPATSEINEIDLTTEIGETMMMGLRLVREGVSSQDFLKRFGRELDSVFGSQIEQLTKQGLIEWSGNDQTVLRLTERGRLLGNRVFREFI